MILIYSMPTCVQCDVAATILAANDIPYKKVDIYEDNEAMNNMRDLGLRSVPQIFIEDKDALVRLGDLKALMALTDEQLQQLK